MVLDASVAIKFVVAEAGSAEALALLRRSGQRIAPSWILIEAAQALWNKTRRSCLAEEEARRALDALPAFFDALSPAEELLADAIDLAFRLRHPVYDCMYLALAMREQAQVVTADREFAVSAGRAGLAPHVELLTWPTN